MSQKHNIKRQNYEKRQEEKADKVFKIVCISIFVLGVLLAIAYSVAAFVLCINTKDKEYVAGNRKKILG